MFETWEWRVQYVGLISNDSESTVKQIKNCCKKLVYLKLRLALNIVKHCLHVWLRLLSNRAAIFIAPLIKTSYRDRETETGPRH